MTVLFMKSCLKVLERQGCSTRTCSHVTACQDSQRQSEERDPTEHTDSESEDHCEYVCKFTQVPVQSPCHLTQV